MVEHWFTLMPYNVSLQLFQTGERFVLHVQVPFDSPLLFFASDFRLFLHFLQCILQLFALPRRSTLLSMIEAFFMEHFIQRAIRIQTQVLHLRNVQVQLSEHGLLVLGELHVFLDLRLPLLLLLGPNLLQLMQLQLVFTRQLLFSVSSLESQFQCDMPYLLSVSLRHSHIFLFHL